MIQFLVNKKTAAWLHFLLLLAIGLALTITETKIEHILIAINMLLVNCIYLSHADLGKTNQIRLKLIIGILFTGFCIWQYQTHHIKNFLILNLTFFVAMLSKLEPKHAELKKIALLSLPIPLAFMVLHWIATNSINFKSFTVNIWYSYFVAISVYLLGTNIEHIKRHIAPAMLVWVCLYVILQMLAYATGYNLYGTTKNPHYLALYSALSLTITIFLLFILKNRFLKTLTLGLGAILSYFILISSSRPVWIGLLVSALAASMMLNRKQVLVFIAIIIFGQVTLLSLNISNYRDRTLDLFSNIQTEERVYIWHEAWALQKTSNVKEWVIGHGVGKFRKQFAEHSKYNSPTQYHSPHNIFLDILFSSGLLGLFLLLYMYAKIYRKLWESFRQGYKKLSIMLVCVLTTNLIFNSINMPFFIVYNIYQIAFVVGTLLLLRKITPNPN